MKRSSGLCSSYYAPPQFLQHEVTRRITVALRLASLGLALLAFPDESVAALKSKWSEHYDLQNTPVHMVLSPSADATRHSRLIWWRGFERTGGQWGGYLDWRPRSDTTVTNWPDSNFVSSGSANFSPGTFDVFCAGHSHVAAGGGRILVSGGTSTVDGEVGMPHNLLLDPATMTWDSTSAGNMEGRRWYPTNTQLGSDKVVVSSGSQYFHDIVFGGLRGTDTDPSDRRVRAMRETSFGGFETETLFPDPATTSPWPTARTGATATDPRSGTLAYFGGRVGTTSYSDQVWYLFPNEGTASDDYPYAWQNRTPLTIGPGVRAEATFATVARDKLVVWGGRNAAGPVSDTNAHLYKYVSNSGQWTTLTTTGVAPTARTGHFSVGNARDSVFIFGGATDASGTVTTDAAVHLLVVRDTIGEPSSGVWSTLTTTGTAPPLAAGGMMAFDTEAHPRASDATVPDQNCRRLILFGGKDASGNYSDKIWILRLKPSGAQWLSVTPTQTGIGRERAGFVYNESLARLYIFGGERSGTRLADVKWIDLADIDAPTPKTWQSLPSLAAATSGHTVIPNRSVTFFRQPEVYSPSDTQWTTLTPRLQEWYPFGFTIPSALAGGNGTRVLYAGPSDNAYWLDPNNPPNSWSVGPGLAGFRGGSAVMYRIGKILKTGTRDTEIGQVAKSRSAVLDLTLTSPAWVSSVDTMSVGRVNHNMVLLPTGDVFCTGGTGKVDNSHDTDPRTTPEIYDVATGKWYGGKLPGSADTLDLDHHFRGYHSNAMLLPDGRILCGGGNATDAPGHHHDRNTFNIFTPPYLFNASGALATRPVLTQWDKKTDLGQWTPFQTDVAVDEVVLLRPGASTHGFNQEQRYLLLDVATSGVKWARIPSDADSLPPGDYLLFALKAKVPAIAQWIRISNVADPKPEKITTLTMACALASDFRVTWTAPHEDHNDVASGRCHDYELWIRDGAAVDTVNLQATNQSLLSTSSPASPGTEESAIVSNLTTIIPGHRYYFRIRSRDAGSPNGQLSAWGHSTSMLASETVDCTPGLSGGGGSGGGGNRVQQAFARIGNGPTLSGNTLLDAVPLGEVRTDVMRLDAAPGLTASLRRAWLRQGAMAGLARLRSMNLIAVDHTEGLEAMAASGQFLAGTRRSATSVTKQSADGGSRVVAPGERVTCGEGDVLEIELSAPEASTVSPLLLVGHSAFVEDIADSGGFVVRSAPVAGPWTTLGHFGARNSDAPLAVGGLTGPRVRIESVGRQTFEFIGQLVTSGVVGHVTRIEPSIAAHSGSGDVLGVLADADSTVDLEPGESLTADFAEPVLESGLTRTWFLEVTGSHESAAAQTAASRSTQVDVPRPLAFGLSQNRPNPFRTSTTLAFTLPAPSSVRLEVFDLSGRRVRTVADSRFEAGEHRVTWDGRDDRGTPAGAGVYLYRMSSEGRRLERKLIILKK